MTIDGWVDDEVFQGYGVIEWNSGDVYIGDMKDGNREGSGIWRSADGCKEVSEYGCRRLPILDLT